MTISVGNLIVAGGATVDTSEVLSALNKQGLKVWVGTTSQRDALPENVKNDDKITFLTYDSEEDIYLIVDTIISYSKTWSSVKISTELAKKINSSDVYTKTEVMSLINAKVASALKYKGAVATTAALPSSGQENGDSYYVQADGYMYAWSDDYSDWQALGSATDMTDYYTKSEVDAIAADLAVKFQFTTMPTADSTTVGKIIQYTGADTNDYKNGYWYKGIDNGDSTYSWTVYTDDKYALSIYSNDLQLTYEGSTYPTTSALITQLTSDIIARKHSSGTVGGNIAITWTGKSCVTGSYSIHDSGAGFVVLDFENAQDGNKHCAYYISNGSATGITWSNLATTDYVDSKVREVFRIPYNISVSNFLARFTQTGIYKGEAFIEDSIAGTTINHWCAYDVTIASATSNAYVGNIMLTDLSTGTVYIYQSYGLNAFSWNLVNQLATANGTLKPISGLSDANSATANSSIKYAVSSNTTANLPTDISVLYGLLEISQNSVGNSIVQTLTAVYYGTNNEALSASYHRSAYFNGNNWIWSDWERLATKSKLITTGDLNDLTVDGKYYGNSSVNISNMPSDVTHQWHLTVEQTTDGCIQKMDVGVTLTDGANHLWIRQLYNWGSPAWTAWAKIY